MFIIYSRTVCSGCDTAKAFLTMKGEEWRVENIETNVDARKDFKMYFPNAKSVPKIIHYDGEQSLTAIDTLEELEAFVRDSLVK